MRVKLGCCLIAFCAVFLFTADTQVNANATTQTQVQAQPATEAIKEYTLHMPDGSEVKTLSPYYNAAYLEIAAMLDGRQALSLKRAAFLVEWAYLDGKPDYKVFCDSIARIAKTLNTFIKLNKLDQNPIGKNLAIFEFMSNPSPLNGFREYVYDFEDFRGDNDLTNLFVTKLMRTHSGQCRSLPLFYKILADEIGAEAYMAYLPDHSFIRHRDEKGTGWINVELTNHSMPRDVFIIETENITKKAIKKGTFMKPCDDRQVVINLLDDLANAYFAKYSVIDDFSSLCLGKVFRYDPDNLTGLTIANNCLFRIIDHYKAGLVEKGLPDDDYLKSLVAQIKDVKKKIYETGYVDESQEHHDEWVKSVQDEMERRKQHGLRIK